MRSLARALDHPDPAQALSELASSIGTPTRLADVGFSPAGVENEPASMNKDSRKDLIDHAVLQGFRRGSAA